MLIGEFGRDSIFFFSRSKCNEVSIGIPRSPHVGHRGITLLKFSGISGIFVSIRAERHSRWLLCPQLRMTIFSPVSVFSSSSSQKQQLPQSDLSIRAVWIVMTYGVTDGGDLMYCDCKSEARGGEYKGDFCTCLICRGKVILLLVSKSSGGGMFCFAFLCLCLVVLIRRSSKLHDS